MIFFSHARTAFKYSIKSLDYHSNSVVLLPDLNCDTLIDCQSDLNIKFIFYKVKFNFEPDWTDIKTKINSDTLALLVVNYFGIPNAIKKAVDFCSNNKLILIEDNSHGFKGFLDNKELGSYGDFGISSPRKHLPIKYGGTLHSKNSIKLDNYKLKKNPNGIYNKINFSLTNQYPNFKFIIKKLLTKQPDYYLDKSEDKIQDFLLDNYSYNIIKTTNWDSLKNYKYENYLKWNLFAKNNYLTPAINHNFQDINPWCFPVIIKSNLVSSKWLDWSWANNIISFTWPTLPSQIKKSSDAYKISNSLLCFSTYFSPKNY